MGEQEVRKMRPIFIAKYLAKYSDEKNHVKESTLIDYLYGEFETMPDRKTIQRDIAMLRDDFGMDIEKDSKGYYIASREFELDDLRLLSECVYAAKFISEEKSKELIDVLCDFCSDFQAEELRQDVYLCDRVKTTQNGTLRLISKIRSAMHPHPAHSQGKKITFQYATHSITDVHKIIDKHDGKTYTVSPFKLVINDGNYYLIAFDDESQQMRTYRIDRIRNVEILNERRDGGRALHQMNVDSYIRRTFSMFGGEDAKVKIRFTNDLIDTVVDKFGVGFGAEYDPDGESHFIVTADVAVSDQFYAWVCGFGTKAKIIAPEKVAADFRKYLSSIVNQY